MLKLRTPLVALLASISLLFLALLPAKADQTCLRKDYVIGICEIRIDDPLRPGGPGGGGGGTTAPRQCQYEGAPVPCEHDGRRWISSRAAWCKVAAPQPPKSDPVWQNQASGVILDCQLRGTTGFGPFFRVWSPSAEERPDPAVLARQAVASMGLEAIHIGIVPRSMEHSRRAFGWVGMKVWMWAENPDSTTWGPKTATANLGAHSVTATAKVSKVVWDMGDGNTVTCRAPGTSWSQHKARDNRPSPDCGYVYEREAPTDDGYPVTATSHWEVAWEGMGESGTITFTLQRSVHLMIGEIQVLNGKAR